MPGKSKSKPEAQRSAGRSSKSRTKSARPLRKSPQPQSKRPQPEGERLQKVLSAAGLGSRRACEELITAGRVEVDRTMVTQLGTRVDPHRQEIRVDGQPLPQPKRIYYAVNKPPGVVSTHRDPARRERVIDLVPGDPEGLITVGRLDLGSEGLILVTNDGDLANRLTHPRYGIHKTYRVQVAGCPDREVLAALRRGIHLAEGRVHAESVVLKSQRKQSAILEIVLTEGRNREIRRMLARLGHKVTHLARIAVGPVRLGNLPPGSYRPLTRQEVVALRRATGEGTA